MNITEITIEATKIEEKIRQIENVAYASAAVLGGVVAATIVGVVLVAKKGGRGGS